MPKIIDVTGQKFGRLTVLRPYRGYKKKKWECKCDCGNIHFASATDLIKGNTKSCSCLLYEKGRNRIHGLAKTKINDVYHHLKQRCTNPNDKGYKDYGGRGIKCEWENFQNFNTDMGESYMIHIGTHGKNTFLERIDNDGNYCKDNCRRATRTEQNNNRRQSIRINGKTFREISNETGISAKKLYSRYYKGSFFI